MIKKLLNWIRKLDNIEITVESSTVCKSLLTYKYFNKFQSKKWDNNFASMNNKTLTLRKIVAVGIPIRVFYACN